MKKSMQKYLKYLKYLLPGLGILNWIVIPLKISILFICSVFTRIVEPYKTVKEIPDMESDIDEKIERYEKRIESEFRYKGFVLCQKNGEPDGKNHYVSDWCLWEGVRIAILSWNSKFKKSDTRQLFQEFEIYISNWLDDEGNLYRGWTWEGESRNYVQDVSIDQMSGFVFALSQVPFEFLKAKSEIILKYINKIIDNHYIINDKNGNYMRDLRLNIIASGASASILLSLLTIAYRLTNEKKYLYKIFKLKIQGAVLLNLIPSGKLFELVRGFNHNISFLALCAYKTLSKSAITEFGIKWTWWINQKVYNPWWNFLAANFSSIPEKDFRIAKWLFSTIDDSNLKNYKVSSMVQDVKLIYNKYMYVYPPLLKHKKGDCFFLQGVWRDSDHYGFKDLSTLLDNSEYTMLPFIGCYYLMKMNEGIS